MKYLCVFCGSSSGTNQKIIKASAEFGKEIVSHGYGLVYGGASVGIMGAIADQVLEAGGKVIGIIPQTLVDKEVAHFGLSDLQIVGSMHERKQKMYNQSEAFIVLPGGFGTLDEMFEIITWAQIGLHQKKVIILNIDNYFDSLIAFINKASSTGFIKPEYLKLFEVANNGDEVFDLLS